MNRLKHFQLGAVIALFGLSFLLHLVPPFKDVARKIMSVEEQKVLSVSKGFSINEDLIIDVYKVQRGEDIYIEIYDHNTSEMIQSIAFDKSFDTYFKAAGKSANLFLDDVNGDNTLDVIVPAHDKKLFARLHVLTFDQESKQFVLMQQP